MSGFAVAHESTRSSGCAVPTLSWARDYLRTAALADFGCAIIGVFMASQIRFGDQGYRHLCRPEPGPAGALAHSHPETFRRL